MQYGFAGQVHHTVTRQIKASTGAQITVVHSINEYDAIGRVNRVKKRQQHTHIAGNVLSGEKVVSDIQYNALGQVRQKNVGRKGATSNPLETLKYDYNIRGWLLGVNRAFVTTANTAAPDAGKWFGFDLGYDKTANASGNGYTAAQFNGNISGQSWRSAGDNVARQYRYSYDAANRLMKGDFVQNQGSWAKTFNYDSWMGDGNSTTTAYDLNGNIKRMQQWGWASTSATTKIDDLTYTYLHGSTTNQTISNKLQAVSDAITSPAGLGDFINKNTTTSDYGYDRNGNMVTDLNKRLNGSTGNDVPLANGAITYNHLNLPLTIQVKNDNGTTKGTITYTYDAAGTKLRKIVSETGANINGTITNVTCTTHYAGGLVYETKTYFI